MGGKRKAGGPTGYLISDKRQNETQQLFLYEEFLSIEI